MCLAKTKPIVIAVVCLLVVLVCIGGVLIYLQLRAESDESNEPQLIERQPTEIPREPRGVIVTPENVEEVMERMERQAEDAYFTASMNVEWLFPRGDEPSSNAFVANSTANSRTIYFDLLLDATDEILFSSPFIPVGARIDEVLLNTVLPAGNHPATVVYNLVDDDFYEVATVSVAVILRVLE